jgi:FkbM family methyltransferase
MDRVDYSDRVRSPQTNRVRLPQTTGMAMQRMRRARAQMVARLVWLRHLHAQLDEYHETVKSLGATLARLAQLEEQSAARLAQLDEQSATRYAVAMAHIGAPKWGTDAAVSLMPGELLVRTQFGAWLVVPGYNVDVGPGIVRDGLIEPWTTRLVQRLLRPGDTFVNVGANFGYYAVLGATLVQSSGRVIAIEANPHVFPFLLRSVLWSGFSNVVRCYNFAAFSSEGDHLDLHFDPQYISGGTVMDIAKVRDNAPSLHFDKLEEAIWNGANIVQVLSEDRRYTSGQMYCTATAPTQTLDNVLEDVSEDVSLLLMDIEGSEPHALLGARRILSGPRAPDVIMEWAGADRAKQLLNGPIISEALNMLRDNGYSVYEIRSDDPGKLDVLPRLRALKWDDVSELSHGNLFATRDLRTDAEFS